MKIKQYKKQIKQENFTIPEMSEQVRLTAYEKKYNVYKSSKRIWPKIAYTLSPLMFLFLCLIVVIVSKQFGGFATDGKHNDHIEGEPSTGQDAPAPSLSDNSISLDNLNESINNAYDQMQKALSTNSKPSFISFNDHNQKIIKNNNFCFQDNNVIYFSNHQLVYSDMARSSIYVLVDNTNIDNIYLFAYSNKFVAVYNIGSQIFLDVFVGYDYINRCTIQLNGNIREAIRIDCYMNIITTENIYTIDLDNYAIENTSIINNWAFSYYIDGLIYLVSYPVNNLSITKASMQYENIVNSIYTYVYCYSLGQKADYLYTILEKARINSSQSLHYENGYLYILCNSGIKDSNVYIKTYKDGIIISNYNMSEKSTITKVSFRQGRLFLTLSQPNNSVIMFNIEKPLNIFQIFNYIIEDNNDMYALNDEIFIEVSDDSKSLILHKLKNNMLTQIDSINLDETITVDEYSLFEQSDENTFNILMYNDVNVKVMKILITPFTVKIEDINSSTIVWEDSSTNKYHMFEDSLIIMK